MASYIYIMMMHTLQTENQKGERSTIK